MLANEALHTYTHMNIMHLKNWFTGNKTNCVRRNLKLRKKLTVNKVSKYPIQQFPDRQSPLHINKVFLCILTLKLSEKTLYNWLGRPAGNKLCLRLLLWPTTKMRSLSRCQFTFPNSIRLLHYHNNSKIMLRLCPSLGRSKKAGHSLNVDEALNKYNLKNDLKVDS